MIDKRTIVFFVSATICEPVNIKHWTESTNDYYSKIAAFHHAVNAKGSAAQLSSE